MAEAQPDQDRGDLAGAQAKKRDQGASDVDVSDIMAELNPVLDAVLKKLAAIETKLESIPVGPPKPAFVDKHPGWIELPDGERMKAADLRIALLLGKVPETAGLLVDTKTTAKLLNVSPHTLTRLDDLQAMPQPVRLGGTIIPGGWQKFWPGWTRVVRFVGSGRIPTTQPVPNAVAELV